METGLVSRVCNTCKRDVPVERLIKKSDCKGGYAPRCLDCKANSQREHRILSRNQSTKTYEKSLKGYLVRTYRNMLSRVRGILKKKAHLYEGLEILSKDEFYKWSLKSNYPDLLDAYRESGFDMKLAPSIDREDTSLGYTLDNIRWITHSENSKLGSLSGHSK